MHVVLSNQIKLNLRWLQDIAFFDAEAVGALTSRLGSDCQQVSQIIGTDLNIMFRNALQVNCHFLWTSQVVANSLLSCNVVLVKRWTHVESNPGHWSIFVFDGTIVADGLDHIGHLQHYVVLHANLWQVRFFLHCPLSTTYKCLHSTTCIEHISVQRNNYCSMAIAKCYSTDIKKRQPRQHKTQWHQPMR